MQTIRIGDLLADVLAVADPKPLPILGWSAVEWNLVPINWDHVTFLHMATTTGLGFEEARHGNP